MKARVRGLQQTYKLTIFDAPGVKVKWAKSDQFSDFHTKDWSENVPTRAPQAPSAKMGVHSHRLAVTEDDTFGIFESELDSSNPLIEISLLVPFPPPGS